MKIAQPQSHLEIIREGKDAVAAWQAENRTSRLNLQGADLRAVDLSGLDLSRADLAGAKLGGTLKGTDLRGAAFGHANLSQVVLDEVRLGGSVIEDVDFSGADPRTVIVSEPTRFINANFQNAVFKGGSFPGVSAESCRFNNADLSGTNLRGANLTASVFQGAQLDGCDLRGAVLARADLSGASAAGARFNVADLNWTQFEGTRGLDKAFGLDTARGEDPRERSIQNCRRAWPERYVDWERLRTVGRLPLFGASYTALLLIPPFFFGLGHYNDKIVLAREWAERLRQQEGFAHQTLAGLLLERLHPLPLPSDALLMLVATVLLAMASTIYALACPSRVKEFSLDQWCDELDHSIFTYWPLAWKFRWARLTSALFYLVGVSGAVWVIGWKVWHVAQFIWRYSFI